MRLAWPKIIHPPSKHKLWSPQYECTKEWFDNQSSLSWSGKNHRKITWSEGRFFFYDSRLGSRSSLTILFDYHFSHTTSLCDHLVIQEVLYIASFLPFRTKDTSLVSGAWSSLPQLQRRSFSKHHQASQCDLTVQIYDGSRLCNHSEEQYFEVLPQWSPRLAILHCNFARSSPRRFDRTSCSLQNLRVIRPLWRCEPATYKSAKCSSPDYGFVVKTSCRRLLA